LYLFYHYC